MASKQTYPCFVCRKAGYEVPVYLDGKDAEGHTKYLNEDGTKHTHLGSSSQQQQQQAEQQSQGQGQGSTTVLTTEPTAMMKIVNAKLDRIIALLESQQQQQQ